MGLMKGFICAAVATLGWGLLTATTVMCEGRQAEIPLMTQDVRAVHLRDVGANRLYALHFPAALEDLNLSANGLMLLPEGFVPANVKRLWLADNRLMALPKEVAANQALIYLNLDRNRFTELPDLSQTALRWVRLNGNQLKRVPALPDSVERLYLAGNQLRAFHQKPKALRQLKLANNPIESIDPQLGCGLEELDLSGTRLTHLPEALEGWQSLRVLNLARCPLDAAEKDRIEAAFDPLKTLVIF
jgi:Leucine-rich repeat (LRR) protein